MKECVICGNTFEPKKKTQLCCCSACSRERQITVQRWKQKQERENREISKQKALEAQKKAEAKCRKEAKLCGMPVELYAQLSPLSKAARLAKANGMSYGEYTARFL